MLVSMEASCSGRCLDADRLTFCGHQASRRHASATPLCLKPPRQAASTLEAPALLSQNTNAGSNRACMQVSRKQSHREVSCAATPAVEVISLGEVADVEEIEGLRVVMNEYKRPVVEYLIKWKDGSPQTWEPKQNLSDNLLRDFEQSWWTACREGDVEKIRKLLSTSARVLANTIDENRRSGLHFVCATGNLPCVQLFIKAGADLDLGDKDGYTPLHMAVGYSHVAVVAELLDAGANPEMQDRQSRDVIALVESIREKMPISPEWMGKRMALEQVIALLGNNLFEEVEPAVILKDRKNENGTRDFLVKWADGEEDTWVSQWNVASDVVEDFDAGLEYGEAESILKSVQKGDTREYLVRWSDGYEDSWEPEDNLPAPLIEQWEDKQKQRLLESMQTASHSSRSSSNGHLEQSNGVPTRRTGRDKGSAREESRDMQPQPVS